MATLTVGLEERKVKSSNSLGYGALVVFSFLYFARPEDLIPGLGKVPVEKILGGIAFIALFFGIRSRSTFKKWPLELKLLAALLGWQILCIPFASYITGALLVVIDRCSKALIVALLVALVADSIGQVRRLMWIQASAVAFMTFVSVLLYKGGRMGGVLGGVFDNPNDLAMNIALNFPLCLMFLLLEKNPIKKLVWFAGILVMGRGLMLTYSRSGFLAIVVAVIFSLLEFGIRNKRHYLFGAAAFCALALLIAGPQSYGNRIRSLVSNDVEVYGDAKGPRAELLMKSLVITAKHPLFGVGPGQFASYTGKWLVTHNTYTELSSECGIPALILFLLLHCRGGVRQHGVPAFSIFHGRLHDSVISLEQPKARDRCRELPVERHGLLAENPSRLESRVASLKIRPPVSTRRQQRGPLSRIASGNP